MLSNLVQKKKATTSFFKRYIHAHLIQFLGCGRAYTSVTCVQEQ